MVTLYDLMHNTTVQGDVKIRLFRESDYEELAMLKLESVDVLIGEDIPTEWEDLEIRYIYIADNCLNIEIYMEEEE